MFRQYRKIVKDEFILCGVDTCTGMGDYTAAQFLSKTQVNVPLVFHSKVTTSEFIPALHRNLERISDITGVKPVVAIERQNGGVFLMDRLAGMNLNYKYELFTMPGYGTIDNQETKKLGFDTNTATRPKMLSDLKDAIDRRVIGIYDKQTITEAYSFIISQTNTSWKAQAEKGAHDDCFIAGTMVTTDKGQVPIELLKVGDMVLTRKGYRPIIYTRSRYREVTTKYGLTGTKDHPIISAKRNICFDKLKASDIIYIWNEKQSTITEKTITGIQNQTDDNLGSTIGGMTSGRNHQSRFIGRFGLMLMGIFQTICTSTIKTETPLTTILATLGLYQDLNIRRCICEKNQDESYMLKLEKDNLKELLVILSGGNKKILKKLEKFIGKTVLSKKIELQDNSKSGARLMLIKSEKSIEPMEDCKQNALNRHSKSGRRLTKINYRNKQEKTLWLIYMVKKRQSIVSIVVGSLHTLANSVLNTALKVVGQRQGAKQRVYNIQVADTPEYFANGILVHNCIMSLAIAWQLYQMCEPPVTSRRAEAIMKEFPKTSLTNKYGLY